MGLLNIRNTLLGHLCFVSDFFNNVAVTVYFLVIEFICFVANHLSVFWYLGYASCHVMLCVIYVYFLHYLDLVCPKVLWIECSMTALYAWLFQYMQYLLGW